MQEKKHNSKTPKFLVFCTQKVLEKVEKKSKGFRKAIEDNLSSKCKFMKSSRPNEKDTC